MRTNVLEAILEANACKQEIHGLEIVEAPTFPGHFRARFRPIMETV